MLAWCGILALAGFLLGGVAAVNESELRVFARTVGAPLLVIALRHFTPDRLHGAFSPLSFFLEYLFLTCIAFFGDYFVGFRLGKLDAHGYRGDSVGR